jgi:hypothetical protein
LQRSHDPWFAAKADHFRSPVMLGFRIIFFRGPLTAANLATVEVLWAELVNHTTEISVGFVKD